MDVGTSTANDRAHIDVVFVLLYPPSTLGVLILFPIGLQGLISPPFSSRLLLFVAFVCGNL